jgi:hypothetical protein
MAQGRSRGWLAGDPTDTWRASRHGTRCASNRGEARGLKQDDASADSAIAIAFVVLLSAATVLWIAGCMLVLEPRLLMVLLGLNDVRPGLILGGVAVLLALLCCCAAVTLACVVLHKAWSATQSLRNLSERDHAMPTPGEAVGLLFIPVLNVGWLFVACVGLAVRANRLHRIESGEGTVVSPVLAFTMCILLLGSIVPYLCFPLWVPACVVACVWLVQTQRATRRLKDHQVV